MPLETETLPPLSRPRVQVIQVQGFSVVTMDFSSASGSETLAMLEDYRSAIVGQPPDSVRLLVDVAGIAYDSAVSSKWKAVRMELDPYIRASAIYGVQGLVGVAIRSYTELLLWLKLPRAKNKIRVFKSREEALEWLLTT